MDYRYFKGPLHHGHYSWDLGISAHHFSQGMVCDRVYAVPGRAFLDDVFCFCCWYSASNLKACVMGPIDTALFMTFFTYVSDFNLFVSDRPSLFSHNRAVIFVCFNSARLPVFDPQGTICRQCTSRS